MGRGNDSVHCGTPLTAPFDTSQTAVSRSSPADRPTPDPRAERRLSHQAPGGRAAERMARSPSGLRGPATDLRLCCLQQASERGGLARPARRELLTVGGSRVGPSSVLHAQTRTRRCRRQREGHDALPEPAVPTTFKTSRRIDDEHLPGNRAKRIAVHRERSPDSRVKIVWHQPCGQLLRIDEGAPDSRRIRGVVDLVDDRLVANHCLLPGVARVDRGPAPTRRPNGTANRGLRRAVRGAADTGSPARRARG